MITELVKAEKEKLEKLVSRNKLFAKLILLAFNLLKVMVFLIELILASNFISYYEELFDLNKADIQVGITKKERTSQTAQAFVDQIFNNNIDQSKEIENYPNKNKYDYSKTIIKSMYKIHLK